MAERIRRSRDLDVYGRAMDLIMEIFELTRTFPPDERYSLTDQIRRSSRSVCANLGEAWRKRRYGPAFVAKLSDSEAEAGETIVWIEIAERCRYLDAETAERLSLEYDHVIGQLVRMGSEPQKWTL